MNPSSSPRPSPSEPAQGKLIEEYSYDGLRVVSIDKNVFPDRRVRDSYEQPAMRHVHERLLRKLRPDVVHVCHLISHTTALLEVTRRLGIPTFATLTDFFGFCYNNILENTKSELCTGPDALRANCMACFLKLVSTRARTQYCSTGSPIFRSFAGSSLVDSLTSAAEIAARFPSTALRRTISSHAPAFCIAPWAFIAKRSRRRST